MKRTGIITALILASALTMAGARSSELSGLSGHPYDEAMKNLAAGQEDAAYSLLEYVPVDDALFIPAVVQLQKIHYRRGDWQKFFAYAVYYRRKFLSTPADTRRNFNGLLLSLEVMALAKHCKFGPAAELAAGAKRTAADLQLADAREIDRLIDHLKLQSQFAQALAGREDVHRPRPFSNRPLWELDSQKSTWITHPRLLRMIVTSDCGKGAS